MTSSSRRIMDIVLYERITSDDLKAHIRRVGQSLYTRADAAPSGGVGRVPNRQG